MSRFNLLVIGFAGDHTIRHVLQCLAGHDYEFLELFEFYATGEVDLDTAAHRLTIRCSDACLNLSDYKCIYQRLLHPGKSESFGVVPRIQQARFRALDLAIASCQSRVVNNLYAGWENNFKPLQTYLLAEAGFTVPRSLSTSIAEDFKAFSRSRPTIYKSNSGERSVVEEVGNVTPDRLSTLRQCPVFFQERVSGIDVRVHTVGENAFGVAVESGAVDYRYVGRSRQIAHFRPYPDIPTTISDLCVSYAKSRNIYLAGFDFKVTEDNIWYCLEMNPCPGFDSYDRVLGGVIGSSLVASLVN
ncbi:MULTISPECIES: ATP-grasp domain-containing protein [Rhizobium]|uniref:ATP-grasp domain-containing protein n=1 Tax=Rhizobium TaxID=379 RepID=UPI000462D02C|nr:MULTISPECIES: hypothetical protein [Rhizobium]MCS0462932.1 hypothetical protein [Rhizobium favelukesii]UFS82019.1 hypothetical protein LPB79_27680 [Rhizobium sp. T136]